jgi:hypothetical protein
MNMNSLNNNEALWDDDLNLKNFKETDFP